MRQTLLTATDVMKYLYDPRIIYFMYVLKIPQAVTPKEEAGIKKYEVFKLTSKRNKLIRELPYLPKIYDIYLASQKYGLATKIDCIAINKNNGEAYPVQIKDSQKPKTLYKTQKFQIIIEAVLIEEKLGYKVPFGFVKFLKSGDFTKVSINTKLREELLVIVNKIIEIIRDEKFPRKTRYYKRDIDNVYKNIL